MNTIIDYFKGNLITLNTLNMKLEEIWGLTFQYLHFH